MPILNLSKEQYNTFLNSNSLDDFINLRNSIEVNDKLVSIPKNYIAIRILSNKEYEKYINIGTLDGSIIANNINVWHWNNQFQHVDGYADWTDHGIKRDWFTVTSKTDNSVTFVTAWTSDISYHIFISMICEIISNNFSNKNSCAVKKSLFYYRGSVERVGNTDNMYFPTKDFLNSNKNLPTDEISLTTIAFNRGNNFVFHISGNSSFRPVFQFVDNNKSTNIHY